MAPKRYFEDFTLGEIIESRSHTITEEEMRCYIQATDSAHPYHDDPKDSTLRIAPSFPPAEELAKAMEVFCVAARLAMVEKLLA